MRPPASAVALLFGLLVLTGCGGESGPTVVPSPAPPPTPSPGPGDVVVGTHTGPTEIAYLAAEPAPGATINGCGRDASGCVGRVRMRFRLLSASGGAVLDAIGFLHATTKLACYRGTTGRFDLTPGVAREIEIVFAEPDPACGVPATISDMKLVLSGPVETASLQEWAIRFELRP